MPPKPKYNWPLLENGETHTLRRGVDYDCPTQGLRDTIRKRASNQGRRVDVVVIDADTLTVRFSGESFSSGRTQIASSAYTAAVTREGDGWDGVSTPPEEIAAACERIRAGLSEVELARRAGLSTYGVEMNPLDHSVPSRRARLASQKAIQR